MARRTKLALGVIAGVITTALISGVALAVIPVRAE